MEELMRLDLQRFGEGGGGEGGAAGGGEAAGAADAGETGPGKAGKAAKGAGDLSTIQYGVQDEAPEADAQKDETPAPAPRKISFDQALKDNPDYAREMQKRIDQAINKRFAKSKAAEEQNAKLMPALNLLSAKYGVEAGNMEALIDAINGDSDLIEQQAMDAGMEPDAYREFQRLKAENESLKKAEEEREHREHVEQQMQKWRVQEQQAQRIFPSLSLAVESRNPQFNELLAAGIDVLTAFRVVHEDEINAGLIQRAAAEATRKTVAGIAAKSNRPRENGATKPKAATVKADVTKLTRADFDEILKRAARGDEIRF